MSQEVLRPPQIHPAQWHRCYGPECRTEAAAQPAVARLFEAWDKLSEVMPIIDFGWTLYGLVPVFHDRYGKRLRIILLHRHPVTTAASRAIRGDYTDNVLLEPTHPRARFGHYAEIWSHLSAFEKSLYRWLEITAYGFEVAEEYPEIPWSSVRSEDVFEDPRKIREIAEFAGFPPDEFDIRPDAVPKNAMKRVDRELRPIRKEWLRYQRFPELNDLAARLGYDLGPSTVRDLIRKYQRPEGLPAWLRDKLRYWKFRKRAGSLLRGLPSL